MTRAIRRLRLKRSTVRPKTMSNDFGFFFELFSRFEFDFRRGGNDFFSMIRVFWCVRGSITCNSISNVVVSVKIHDNMNICICICICVYNLYGCMCVCMWTHMSAPGRW